jgi:hypothetical protein
MVATINTRWTLRKMAEARAMYEAGAHLAAIVAKCGSTEDSVKTIAAQSGWRRPPQPASADTKRLANVIRSYWRKHGREIELALDGGKIRSRSVNGVPE